MVFFFLNLFCSIFQVLALKINFLLLFLALFVQTKTAKSMVGVSLAVDSTQTLTTAEFIKKRGILLKHFASLLAYDLYREWFI